MKNKIEAIIFDMDGTLYTFDKGQSKQFSSSKFGQQIQDNCINFFAKTFNLSKVEAEKTYQDFKQKYAGEISLGLERDFGIDRSFYFSQTWNLNPSEFMEVDKQLAKELEKLTIKTGILSAAPKIWVEKVLDFLQIKDRFAQAIFTGEPDLRKPDPQAFAQLATLWQLSPQSILAIGDQEETDILPAKTLGMLTARVGSSLNTSADFSAENVIILLNDLRQKGLV